MASAVLYRGKNNCAFVCRLSWSLLYTVYVSITSSLLTLITIREIIHDHNFFEIFFSYFFYGTASVSLLLCSSIMHSFFHFLIKTSETQRLRSTLGLGIIRESNKNFSTAGLYCCNLEVNISHLLYFRGFWLEIRVERGANASIKVKAGASSLHPASSGGREGSDLSGPMDLS